MCVCVCVTKKIIHISVLNHPNAIVLLEVKQDIIEDMGEE